MMTRMMVTTRMTVTTWITVTTRMMVMTQMMVMTRMMVTMTMSLTYWKKSLTMKLETRILQQDMRCMGDRSCQWVEYDVLLSRGDTFYTRGL